MWMLEELLFSSHIVPWQFFISLVLLRCHPERHKEAVENNLDIVFFNPSFKANQQRRILFWESCVEMWVSTSMCFLFILKTLASEMFSVCQSKDEGSRKQGGLRWLWAHLGSLQLWSAPCPSSQCFPSKPYNILHLWRGRYLADLVSSFQFGTVCFTDCFIDFFIDTCMDCCMNCCIPSWHWCLNTTKKRAIQCQYRPCASFGRDADWKEVVDEYNSRANKQ